MSTYDLNPFGGLAVMNPVEPARPQAGPPATEKQLSFLRKLISERYDVAGAEAWESALSKVTKTAASKAIDDLLKMPKLQGTTRSTRVEPPEGFHYHRNSVWKVQRAVHGSGNLYAKRLVPPPVDPVLGRSSRKGEWEYIGRGATFWELSTDTLLTLEKAKELGHLYGVCCVCGATLTDERSIEAGIGPVCGSRL